jgi:hypothetical protein
MSIWRYIPRVPRPWNPAYRGVWDLMTTREKQWSFIIDFAVILIAGALGWWFA